MIFNAGKFVPGEWLNIGDKDYFSGDTWENGRAASITDFWPKDSTLPTQFAPALPEIVLGNGLVYDFVLGAHKQQIKVNIESNRAKLVFNTIYFPGWKISVDGKSMPMQTHSSMNLISTILMQGEHKIDLRFEDTPPRLIGNLVSLITLVSLVIWRLKYVAA